MDPRRLGTPRPLAHRLARGLRDDGAGADSDHLVGALVLTIAVIATAEVIRAARFLIGILALWLIVAPWVLAGFSGLAAANGMIAAILLGLASLPRGRVTERYARWDRYVV